MENKLIKLDIGSGRAHFEDYITVDKDPSVGADLLLDIENMPDIVEGCIKDKDLRGEEVIIPPVDEIRCHHLLEHLDSRNKVKVMATFYDLLKVGGILDIEVPLFPHPASVQDPTHISFWVAESFKYFTKDSVKRPNKFGEAFAKRYSEYPVPLFEFVEDFHRGEKGNYWAYGIKLRKI